MRNCQPPKRQLCLCQRACLLLAGALLLLPGLAHAAAAPYRLGVSTRSVQFEEPLNKGGSIWLKHPSNFGWGVESYKYGTYYSRTNIVAGSTTLQTLQGFYSLNLSWFFIDLGAGAGRSSQQGEDAIYFQDGVVREKFIRFGFVFGRLGLHAAKIYETHQRNKNEVHSPYQPQEAGSITTTTPRWFSGVSWDF